MELLNTIEIEPWDYTENEYEFPNISRDKSPEKWSEFWYKCISDSKLQDFKPVELGSYLVDIESVKDSELKIILKNKLNEVDLSNYQEYVGQIVGGIVIKNKGKVIIEPTCCGDLSNIQNWEEIEKTELNKWTQLWVGHPWLFYKRNNDTVSFSEYTDFSLEDFKGMSEKFKLSEKELFAEIRSVRKGLNRFENRIKKALIEMGIENSDKIAKLMTGSS
ncbi:conserved hypothetical protein [Tenacibaculum sp. 190524A02b]|uniref:Uncharacterized protein n=1 Tax=Tenacibaculum vairaonense TaxID=3137860 RepID=A0ABP1F7K2_9FLAO